MKYMKYFEKYLTEGTQNNDIDISVHCDIKIFEWLVKYLKQKERTPENEAFAAKHCQYRKKTEEERQRDKEESEKMPANCQPVLDLKNVISILISSDFLQMKDLVQECISYVVSNLHDVVRLPIDMNCLNSDLIKQIAEKTPMDKLNTLLDKRDKLTSKLFKKKLEKLLYACMHNNLPIYSQDLHDYLWRPKTMAELNKSAQL